MSAMKTCLRAALLAAAVPCQLAAASMVIDVPATLGALNAAVDAVAAAAKSSSTRKGKGHSDSPAPLLRLARGRHQLLRPLELTAVHSGLHFAGDEGGGTVISGGLEIPPGDWTKFKTAVCAGCGDVMRAPLAAGTNYSRQLYVGQPPTRANWTNVLFPAGAKETAVGYSVGASQNLTAGWTHNNGRRIEMVYRGTHSSGAQWTESRNWAAGFDASSGEFTMAAAGFAAGKNKAYNQHLGVPEYVQNVFELLGATEGGRPGDWYLDLDEESSKGGFVYYVTAEAEAGHPIKAILPQLELLVHGKSGMANVMWTDVTFSDATWLTPSTAVGFIEMQAGCTLRGATPPAGLSDWDDDSLWTPTTANILLEGVNGARFDRCTFTRLGACGVSLEGGAQNNSIADSIFADISASAVSIGRVNSYNITDRSKHDAGNTVSDCRIVDVATEFHGAPGVAVFYSRGTRLVHNEIANLPYTGVSIGWGWGRTMEIVWPSMPWDAENEVSFNDIHDVMTILGDGGSIYTLGPQGNKPFPKGPSKKVYPAAPQSPLSVLPPSKMIGNYIHDTGPPCLVSGPPCDAPGAGSHFPGGLYNDEGTTNWAMVGNVVVDTPAWLQGCRFPDGWIGHMNQTSNWIACDSQLRHGQGQGCALINANTTAADCDVSNDVHYPNRQSMPAAAQAVMKNAGPRNSLRLHKTYGYDDEK